MKRSRRCGVLGAIPVARSFLLFALVLCPDVATAQVEGDLGRMEPGVSQGDMEEARRHFVSAVGLFHDGNLEAALAEFRESYRINPLPQVLYNIAVVQRDLHRYAEAVDTLRHYVEVGVGEPDRRRAVARELLAELEGVLASIHIACEQSGADLFVDGLHTGQTPLDAPLRLAAGQYELELRLDGFSTYRQSLEVFGGQELNLDVELNTIRPPWHRTWWFWTSVGGGVVVVATIIILGVVLTRPSSAEFGVSVVSAEAQ